MGKKLYGNESKSYKNTKKNLAFYELLDDALH